MAGRGVEDEWGAAGRDRPQGAGELPSRFTEFAGWVVDWGQGPPCIVGRSLPAPNPEPPHRLEYVRGGLRCTCGAFWFCEINGDTEDRRVFDATDHLYLSAPQEADHRRGDGGL